VWFKSQGGTVSQGADQSLLVILGKHLEQVGRTTVEDRLGVAPSEDGAELGVDAPAKGADLDAQSVCPDLNFKSQGGTVSQGADQSLLVIDWTELCVFFKGTGRIKRTADKSLLMILGNYLSSSLTDLGLLSASAIIGTTASV